MQRICQALELNLEEYIGFMVMFLHTNNKIEERETKKTIQFTIETKNNKIPMSKLN